MTETINRYSERTIRAALRGRPAWNSIFCNTIDQSFNEGIDPTPGGHGGPPLQYVLREHKRCIVQSLPMTAAPSIVHVIVDPDYGERLRDLPESESAWVADTPGNNPVIKSIVATHSGEPYPGFLKGITAFTVPTDKTPEDWLLGVLSPVEDHHCGYSQSPPYSTLRVIGTALTPRIRIQLESYDFVKFEDLPEGFLAHKSADAL